MEHEASKFLAALGGGKFIFMAYAGGVIKTLHGTFPEHRATLEALNKKKLHIAVTVNETAGAKRTAKDVVRARALFIDLDGADIIPVLQGKVVPEPNIVIATSPGRYHCYWLPSEEIPLEEFTELQRFLASSYGADKACVDLPRVMRLPGFYNFKIGEPFKCEITRCELTNRPSMDVFREAMLAGGDNTTGGGRPAIDAPDEYPPLGDVEEVREALKCISSDDYHEWITVGMALKASFGDMAFDVWDTWSAESEKYKEGETQRKWSSFKRNAGGVTHRTIFELAYSRGFTGIHREEASGVDISEIISEPKEEKRPSRSSLCMPDALALRAPGVVGELVRWMTETAIRPQPGLALGAAICLVGALKGHRVKTVTNLRTNFLICGLAPSGRGKNHALDATQSVLGALHQSLLFGGKPTSDAALLRMLEENNGKRLILWDEIGYAIEALTKPTAQSHQRMIVNTIMEVFSAAGMTYYGKEYANHDGKMTRKDIKEPCLCVYGTSTPGRLYGAFSSEYAADGFVGRWLFFEAEHSCLPKRRGEGIGDVDVPPEGLLQNLYEVACGELPGEAGNLMGITAPQEAVPVRFTPEAEELFLEADNDFDTRANAAMGDDRGLDALWIRAGEHVQKIALTVSDGAEVGEEEVSWAISVVERCIGGMAEAIKANVSDSPIQRHTNRMLELIRRSKRISRSELTRKTQWVDSRTRGQILQTLIEGEQVAAVEDKTRGRKVVYYSASR